MVLGLGRHNGTRDFDPAISVAHAYGVKVGLNINWTDPLITVPELAWLTQPPKQFDLKSSHHPRFHCIDGTSQDGLESVFSAIAQGLDHAQGHRLCFQSALKLSVHCIVTHAGLNTTLESVKQGGGRSAVRAHWI
jgi:hypothetical protein